MKTIKYWRICVLGLVFGLFLGGIYRALPKSDSAEQSVDKAQIKDSLLRNIKYDIIYKRNVIDYKKLKELSGGRLQKEDLFYAMVMNEYYDNDTIYKDLRNALIEIYNIPPRDSITLGLIKALDRCHRNRKNKN